MFGIYVLLYKKFVSVCKEEKKKKEKEIDQS